MGALLQDLRYGLRMLHKNPGFTAVAIVTLALGIGANTAIFSVVDAMLLRALPLPNGERLVQVWNKLPEHGLPQLWLSEPEFLDYQRNQQIFDGFAVFSAGGGNLTGQGEPLRVSVVDVSAEFFPALGVGPMLGRVFTEEDDRPGNDRVLVLEHGFWNSRFAGDREIVGKNVVLNGNTYDVIGVMPPGFSFPLADVDMWTPWPSILRNRGRGVTTVWRRSLG